MRNNKSSRLIAPCAALLLAFSLAGCDDVAGKLEVFHNFALTDDDGRSVTLLKGEYEASLDLDKGEKELELDVEDVAGDSDFEFDFSIPQEVVDKLGEQGLESHEFVYVLSAEDSGQPHDVNIGYSSIVTDASELMLWRTRCASVMGKPHLARVVKRVIHISAVIHDGEAELATFTATKRFKHRVKIWEGNCGDGDPIVENQD
ncbi:MAG: hypothetical protein OYH77_00395 [Pseudomonadota bacterium]|nr:hypothetical protein [Pseudomonadota bacterium]